MILYKFEIQKCGQIYVHISPIFSCQVTYIYVCAIMLTCVRDCIVTDHIVWYVCAVVQIILNINEHARVLIMYMVSDI